MLYCWGAQRCGSFRPFTVIATSLQILELSQFVTKSVISCECKKNGPVQAVSQHREKLHMAGFARYLSPGRAGGTVFNQPSGSNVHQNRPLFRQYWLASVPNARLKPKSQQIGSENPPSVGLPWSALIGNSSHDKSRPAWSGPVRCQIVQRNLFRGWCVQRLSLPDDRVWSPAC